MAKGTGLSVDKAVDKKKKRETWSQEKRVGDVTEEIRVEKLDNEGYLVVVRKEWYDSKQNWKSEEGKYYSPTNPLDSDESDNPVDTLFNTITGNKK